MAKRQPAHPSLFFSITVVDIRAACRKLRPLRKPQRSLSGQADRRGLVRPTVLTNLQFRLFDAVAAGNQVGSTLVRDRCAGGQLASSP